MLGLGGCNEYEDEPAFESIDDFGRLSEQVEEAAALGLIPTPESPWGPPKDAVQHPGWIARGTNAVRAGLDFAPEEHVLAGVSGPISVISPSSFEALQEQLSSAASVVVISAEYEEAGRAAVALTIARECQGPERHCLIGVTEPGHLPQLTRLARRATDEGVEGLLERLQNSAKATGRTFLYRTIAEGSEVRLAEFRP